jgi:hypothetical protein
MYKTIDSSLIPIAMVYATTCGTESQGKEKQTQAERSPRVRRKSEQKKKLSKARSN